MKVLLSAHSCDPFVGSEPHVGWAAAHTLAKAHEVWVLTGGQSRKGLERAATEGHVPPNVRFLYHAPLRSPRLKSVMLDRMRHWREYYRWSKTVLSPAMEAHDEVGFDLAHHVTFSSWRVASPLWRMPIPFVWGPLGGGDAVPLSLFHTLGGKSAAFEVLRYGADGLARCSPSVRKTARCATAVIGATEQTVYLLGRLRGSTERLHHLSGAFFSSEQLARFPWPAEKSPNDGKLRIFAGGTLLGLKGIAIALHGLTQVRKKGIDVAYHVAGAGPARDHLLQVVARLGLSDSVSITGPLRGEAYVRALQRSHLYLLPSLRDTAGLTMMEAMLCGCVPVVARCGGPADIVNPTCGVLIPVTTAQRMAEDIGEAVAGLAANSDLRSKMAKAARKRIMDCYGETAYLQGINMIYEEAVNAHGQ